MKYRMYVLFNRATALYEGIMLYRSDVVACRAFEATLEANKGKLDPSDLSLYCLGEFDNESAELDAYDIPVHVNFVPKFVPEEEKMSENRDENSVF